MPIPNRPTAIQSAADGLRAIVLNAADGAFIGREDTLMEQLRCSRSTVRQVARLLESEGLLVVKRGLNGGYYGARPNAGTIESAVSTYLVTLDVNPEDTTILSSALWVEAMRKAAVADRTAATETVAKLRKKLMSIKTKATFAEILKIEHNSNLDIFSLTKSRYIELIFDINAVFAARTLKYARHDDDSDEHRTFVLRWKHAKLMELSAIEGGDAELAAMAARHSRDIWHRRVWSSIAHRGVDASR